MALLAKKDDIPLSIIKVKSQGPEINLKMGLVYGNSCSIMMAERPVGYHTIPHVHECEQFNVVLEGEVYLFVEEDAFLLKAGDVHRVPKNALHWAWNKGDITCKMIEVHAPGLQVMQTRIFCFGIVC